MISSHNGRPDSCSPNEAIRRGDTIIVSNHAEADAFATHYAKISKLELTKLREAKRWMQAPSADECAAADFNMDDLNRAIKKMRSRGAADPDEVPLTFLKALGPAAKEELLSIFNQCFNEAEVPQPWRNATIIALLKMGKPASNMESFRPVSLTSCAVKILERMIVHRLYHFAEARGLFSHTQAGFRKNRSCEDQLLRMTQDISDGFHDRKPKRTVMALLDLCRAYDRVWKEDLLLSLVDGGALLKIMRWFHAFLRNRQFKVLLNGSLSRTRWLIHGVPQGAVSSLLLFLFYINTIADNLPDEVRNSIFADDLAIWAGDNQKEKRETASKERSELLKRGAERRLRP